MNVWRLGSCEYFALSESEPVERERRMGVNKNYLACTVVKAFKSCHITRNNMTGLKSFNDRTSKIVLDLLQEFIVERIAVIESGGKR